MSQITIDLDAETAARLAEFAASQGKSIRDAVKDAVNLLLEIDVSGEFGKYKSVGEPNQDSLEAIAEALNPSAITESYNYNEFKEWRKQLKQKIQTENEDGKLNARN